MLYSDCGLNLVGADKQLRALFEKASAACNIFTRHLADYGTEWVLNPLVALYFGVPREAAERSANHH